MAEWVHPITNPKMTTTVTIDKAGRVVIPKNLREEWRLEAGDTLELEAEGEQITLRPARARSPLRKEQGIWVFRSNKELPAAATDQVLHDVRRRRDRDNSGNRL